MMQRPRPATSAGAQDSIGQCSPRLLPPANSSKRLAASMLKRLSLERMGEDDTGQMQRGREAEREMAARRGLAPARHWLPDQHSPRPEAPPASQGAAELESPARMTQTAKGGEVSRRPALPRSGSVPELTGRRAARHGQSRLQRLSPISKSESKTTSALPRSSPPPAQSDSAGSARACTWAVRGGQHESHHAECHTGPHLVLQDSHQVHQVQQYLESRRPNAIVPSLLPSGWCDAPLTQVEGARSGMPLQLTERSPLATIVSSTHAPWRLLGGITTASPRALPEAADVEYQLLRLGAHIETCQTSIGPYQRLLERRLEEHAAWQAQESQGANSQTTPHDALQAQGLPAATTDTHTAASGSAEASRENSAFVSPNANGTAAHASHAADDATFARHSSPSNAIIAATVTMQSAPHDLQPPPPHPHTSHHPTHHWHPHTSHHPSHPGALVSSVSPVLEPLPFTPRLIGGGGGGGGGGGEGAAAAAAAAAAAGGAEEGEGGGVYSSEAAVQRDTHAPTGGESRSPPVSRLSSRTARLTSVSRAQALPLKCSARLSPAPGHLSTPVPPLDFLPVPSPAGSPSALAALGVCVCVCE